MNQCDCYYNTASTHTQVMENLEWVQRNCTDNSKFEKLDTRETSAQPSIVLSKQL